MKKHCSELRVRYLFENYFWGFFYKISSASACNTMNSENCLVSNCNWTVSCINKETYTVWCCFFVWCLVTDATDSSVADVCHYLCA